MGKNCDFQSIMVGFMHGTWRAVLKFMHWIWRWASSAVESK